MTDKDTSSWDDECEISPSFSGLEPPECDIAKYRGLVENFELSPEEEAELIKSIWTIMAAFVDLGFGLDSINCLSLFNQSAEAPPPEHMDRHDNQAITKGGKDDE